MILLNIHSIDAHIQDRYASIVYSFDFENINKNGSNELKFEITIDTHAFISKFEANIDGKTFIGKTKEKETASKEYSEAKEKNENAILISKPYDDIPNVFEIKTNIDSKSKIALKISIEQYLQKKFNTNQLNIQILRNFTRYNIIKNFEYIAFKVDIKDASGIYDVNIPSTTNGISIEEQNIDKSNHCFIAKGKILKESSINELIIKYKIKGEENDSMVLYDAKSNTFCHVISDIISDSMIKNEQDLNEGQADNVDHSTLLIPRRVVFLIDKSGSMKGVKWRRAISATTTAIKQLRKDYDRYCILFFNREVICLPTDSIVLATESNINETLSSLQNVSASGGTNINDSLLQSIEIIKNDIKLYHDEDDYNFYMNQILFITDGEPNAGERNVHKIISNVKEANVLKDIDRYMSKICMFSFGVGSDCNDSSWIKDLNHSFLKLLSLNNNGFYHRIKSCNTDTALTEYFEILSKPLLFDIKVQYNHKNIHQLSNTTFHTLYAGNDIIICGKIDNIHQKQLCLDVTITAVTGKEIRTANTDKCITKPVYICKEMKVNIDIKAEEEQIANDGNNHIERIWAYLKLQEFATKKLIYNDLIEISEEEKKNDDALPVTLAMQYQFVTPWTSMIVVEKKDEIIKQPLTIAQNDDDDKATAHNVENAMDCTDNDNSMDCGFIDDMFADADPRTREIFRGLCFDDDIDTCNFDTLDAAEPKSSLITKDKSHFWGYTFKRDDANAYLPALSSVPLYPRTVERLQSESLFTQQKVQQMKKRVESTISERISEVNQPRLRSLTQQHKLKANKYFKQMDEISDFGDAKKKRSKSVNDFKIIKMLEKGKFGEICLVRDVADNAVYCMKKVRKRHQVARDARHNYNEWLATQFADNHWFVTVYHSFQEGPYLYLVMEYCEGGDLMSLLIKKDILSEAQTRLYMRQLNEAIHAMHELDFVHRDLKSDKILITKRGHIRLSAFSFAREFNVENDQIIAEYQLKKDALKDNNDDENGSCQKGKEFGHSADYMAPEVFNCKGYDKMVDYWSMGVIMFECIVGYTPFHAQDVLQTCRNIVYYRKCFKMPKDVNVSPSCSDVIRSLICSHRRRYSYHQIKSHPFFNKQ